MAKALAGFEPRSLESKASALALLPSLRPRLIRVFLKVGFFRIKFPSSKPSFDETQNRNEHLCLLLLQPNNNKKIRLTPPPSFSPYFNWNWNSDWKKKKRIFIRVDWRETGREGGRGRERERERERESWAAGAWASGVLFDWRVCHFPIQRD